MPEHDDELSAALRDYYAAMARQPAPDVTGRVMMSADRRNTRIRRWSAVGGGALAAAAIGAVVAVAFITHKQPGVAGPAHRSTPGPTATTVPPSPSASPTLPQTPPFGGGDPVKGFVPTDVTAISSNEWWVLGYNGPSCSSASCTRIVHTTDGGFHFTSIPVPPVAPAQNGKQALRLRFADASDGWVVDGSGSVWATHDGGMQWTAVGNGTPVTDLEASGGAVFAIGCPGTACWIERSPTTHDSWMVLPQPGGGTRRLGHLNVNGSHVWVTFESPAGEPGLVLESTDGGESFGKYVICGSALGFPDLYADDGSTLWATCATGTQAEAYRSTDGGKSFTQLTGSTGLPNFATIAGVSPTTAVIAGQGLIRTTDGGQTFATVENSQSQWTVIGFTTPQDGFAFDNSGSAQSQLWRTDDAGVHWHRLTFP